MGNIVLKIASNLCVRKQEVENVSDADLLSNGVRLLIAGFGMGWGPCLAYTAPLLLPYIGATKRNWQDCLKVGLVFSIGRLLAFTILGGLATAAFGFVNRFFPPQKSGWLYFIVAFFFFSLSQSKILTAPFTIFALHFGNVGSGLM